MCATQARTSVAQLGLRRRVAALDLRRLLEQRVHQLLEDLEQQRAAWSRCSGRARRCAGPVASLSSSMLVAWKPRRANSAAAIATTSCWRRSYFSRSAGEREAFVTSVRYKYGMNFDLPDDHELIRRTVRDFAESEVAPVAEELDRTKSFPYAIVKQLGELGLMGIPFPEEYGGGGGDSLAYAIAVEELTRVDSSVAITLCAHTSLGTQPIYLFGTEEQKQEWMPKLTSGRAPRRVRADRAGGGLGRRQRPHARDARATASGRSTAPSSSSPTPARTSPAWSASPRRPATTRSPT